MRKRIHVFQLPSKRFAVMDMTPYECARMSWWLFGPLVAMYNFMYLCAWEIVDRVRRR